MTPLAGAGHQRPGMSWRWGLALGVALLAHVAAAIPFLYTPAKQQAAPAAILVDLALVAAAPPAPPADQVAEQVIEEKRPREPEPEPEPEPIPEKLSEVAIEKPKPEPKPVREEVVEAKEADEVQESAAPPQVEAPPAEQLAGALNTGAGEIADQQRRWEGQVMMHLERRKRYPRQARMMRHEGTPRLEIRMDRSGNVQQVELLDACPHRILNDDALALVQRASPLPSPPPEVAGDPLVLTLPIEYSLHD